MKKVVKLFFSILAVVSFILMCAERPDGSINLLWSLGWLAALVASSLILDKMGAFHKSH